MLTRRKLLQGVVASAAAAGAGAGLLRRPARAGGRASNFLITVGCFGGASIIDSFMAISEDDDGVTPEIAATLNCFAPSEIVEYGDSPFRAVDRQASLFGNNYVGNQSAFLDAHRHEMVVATQTMTSVNHTVAQKRSVTGNGAWNGRTLMEAVAAEFGAGRPLPNVTMGSLGFRADGDDESLAPEAYAEPVADPMRWPLALDGVEGVEGHPDKEIVELARAVRNEELDPESKFWQTFQLSEKLNRWKKQREEDLPTIETAEVLQKLNFGLGHPSLPEFDQNDLAALETVFGNLSIDPLEDQAAMAYLLLKHGLSVATTISPNWNMVTHPGGGPNNILNPPLSFDYSHTQHRITQTIMWQRMLSVVDGLINLLSTTEHPESPGASLWEHTVIYMATDFGRSKGRQNGSGHHLNNGSAVLSGGLLNGNTLLGGVEPTTGMTYGYNPMNGAPDDTVEMAEDVLYAGILQALGVDTSGSGLPSVDAMVA